jgi:thiamine biosynthesis protein ThiS
MVAKQGCQPDMGIDIVVNGDRHTAAQGQTILGLLTELGLDPARVAVELDRRIVKQPLWKETVLRDGAELEIVQFVGGG